MGFDDLHAQAAFDMMQLVGKPGFYQPPKGAPVPCLVAVTHTSASQGRNGMIAGALSHATLLRSEVGSYTKDAIVTDHKGNSYRVNGKDIDDGAILRLVVSPA